MLVRCRLSSSGFGHEFDYYELVQGTLIVAAFVSKGAQILLKVKRCEQYSTKRLRLLLLVTPDRIFVRRVVFLCVIHCPFCADVLGRLVPATVVLVEDRRFREVVIQEVAVFILNQTVRQRVCAILSLARVSDSVNWAIPLIIHL
jgi:hypothetical protein